jgi:phage terminase small subunit
MPRARRMTPKQRLFIAEFMKDFSPMRAAARAGYSGGENSSQGYRVLRMPAVREAVDAAVDARIAAAALEEQRVLAELRLIAFARLKTVVDWGERDGKAYVDVRPAADLSDDEAAAIAEVSPVPGGLKVKMADRQAALLALARRLDILNDRAAAREEPEAEGRRGLAPGEALAADLAGLPREARDAIRAVILKHRPIEGVAVVKRLEG